MGSRIKWVGLLLLFILLLSNCAKNNWREPVLLGSTARDNLDQNGRLVLALHGEPGHLNPLFSTEENAKVVQSFIFQGLVRLDNNLNVIPELAERWEVSPDGLKWTFYLRKDVQWHDGAPFTAEDVKFTFDAVIDPRINSPYRETFTVSGQPVVFTILDRYTVRADLPGPYAPFLVNMTMGILPKHILEKRSMGTDAFNRRPIGTGPFMFFEWRQGDRIMLLANKTFYRGMPSLAGIVFNIMPVPREEAEFIALRNGDIDVGEFLTPGEGFISRNNILEYRYDRPGYVFLGLNMKNHVFSDKKIRQALALSIDRAALTSFLFKEFARPAYSPFDLSYGEHVPKHAYATANALAMLNKAGWSLNERTKLLEKEGKPFVFTLLVSSRIPYGREAARYLQRYFKDIGIIMEAQPIDAFSLRQLLTVRPTPNFDAVLMDGNSGLDPDNAYLAWHSTQGGAQWGYQNRSLDVLLEKGRKTTYQAKREGIYSKAARILSDDQPGIILWRYRAVVGVNKRVGGYGFPGVTGLFPYPEKVFVTK